MPLKLNIEIPDSIIEDVIRSTMSNYPEAGGGSTLKCSKWRYPDDKPLSEWKFEFYDSDEDNKTYKIGEPELKKAFALMFTDKWPRGLPRPPYSDSKDEWDTWLNNADVETHDAFAQLACFGEVIYG